MKINYNKKYKIGDMIYPHYNRTAVWYKKSIWGVVMKVDEEKEAKAIRLFEDHDIAFVFSELIKHLLKSEGEVSRNKTKQHTRK